MSAWVTTLDERIGVVVGIRERGANRFSLLADPKAVVVGTLALALLPALRPPTRRKAT